jgi:uncharacterized protein (TIGR00106 family)
VPAFELNCYESADGDLFEGDTQMVILEFSVTPLGVGESVSKYVARCLEIVEQSGLDYQLHAMGTLVEGELAPVLNVMQRCIEAVAADCPRVTCAAKLDYRPGHVGRLAKKVQSVEQQVGRQLRTATDDA